MYSYTLPLLAALPSLALAQTHGEGALGTTMGPVAFLWPPNRPWDEANQNDGPCGSATGPTNRTDFPISQGAVALTIADDAWNLAFRLATSDGEYTKRRWSGNIAD
jgi:hypothetical protein